jgi:hypothetical protein
MHELEQKSSGYDIGRGDNHGWKGQAGISEEYYESLNFLIQKM